MNIDVNIINPFLSAVTSTGKMVANMEFTLGKPYIRGLDFSQNEILITIGVTGAMTGQVILSLPEQNAIQLASAMMMGMSVEKLDDMAISAISEFANMTMGNAATLLSNEKIIIDITPPLLQRGMIHLGQHFPVNICIPLLREEMIFANMNILVKRQD